MGLVIDTSALIAIERAGDKADQREQIAEKMLETKDFDSPVGRFSIDASGDTTLDRIAGYTISGGQPKFAAALRGDRAPLKPQP